MYNYITMRQAITTYHHLHLQNPHHHPHLHHLNLPLHRNLLLNNREKFKLISEQNFQIREKKLHHRNKLTRRE